MEIISFIGNCWTVIRILREAVNLGSWCFGSFIWSDIQLLATLIVLILLLSCSPDLITKAVHLLVNANSKWEVRLMIFFSLLCLNIWFKFTLVLLFSEPLENRMVAWFFFVHTASMAMWVNTWIEDVHLRTAQFDLVTNLQTDIYWLTIGRKKNKAIQAFTLMLLFLRRSK